VILRLFQAAHPLQQLGRRPALTHLTTALLVNGQGAGRFGEGSPQGVPE